MKISFARRFLAILVLICLLITTSCKKEASEKPRFFDPVIDGIAVVPLPPIDPEMADISLDNLEDAIPSHRYIGSAEEPLAVQVDIEMAESGDESEEGDEEYDFEESSDFDFDDESEFDNDDANSL
jgi:hypothetical protein